MRLSYTTASGACVLSASFLPKPVLREKLRVTARAGLLSQTGLNHIVGAAPRRLRSAKIAVLNGSRWELVERRTLESSRHPLHMACGDYKIASAFGADSNSVRGPAMSTLKHFVVHRVAAANLPAHRPRASDARFETETLSRGSVQPVFDILIILRHKLTPTITDDPGTLERLPAKQTAINPESMMNPAQRTNCSSGQSQSA
jgi:hypothetical protein